MAYIIDIGSIGYLIPPYFNTDIGNFSGNESTWQDIYKILADNLNSVKDDPPNETTYIYNAFLEMVNLDSDYTTEVAALEMEIYKLWTHSRYTHYFDDNLFSVIKKINDFTEENYGDLTDFVNSIAWDNGCVPYYWGLYSENLGFDTSEWNICS